MKNENNATVTGPRTTSAPLRIKTNVRAGLRGRIGILRYQTG